MWAQLRHRFFSHAHRLATEQNPAPVAAAIALVGLLCSYLIGAFSHATGNFYAALWLLAACLAVAALNVCLVSEEWAAKFSLKQQPHKSAAISSEALRQCSRTASFPLGDAGMLTGMGPLLDNDSDSEPGEAAAGKGCDTPAVAAQADLEAGLGGNAAHSKSNR